MGHSMRNDVDLIHYNYQLEEGLKKIYGGAWNMTILKWIQVSRMKLIKFQVHVLQDFVHSDEVFE